MNALAAAFSLPCLGIRSRNEDAIIINSAQNRFYLLQVLSYFIVVNTFYLFVDWFSMRVSNDRKYMYVCGRRLYNIMMVYHYINDGLLKYTWWHKNLLKFAYISYN